MKRIYNITLLLLVLFLAGCASDMNGESETDPSEDGSALESEEETDATEESGQISEEGDEPEAESNEPAADDMNETSTDETRNEESNNTSASEENNGLAGYSSEEIEFARVWAQLGPNQELDGLYVQHIPAGTPLNPDDDINVSYPEDVIQLTGSRIVDGIVTYSGNGDGTINVYNIPRRWYGGYPPPEDIDKEAVREEREDIIENTEEVYVHPGNDEEVIELIEVLNVHS